MHSMVCNIHIIDSFTKTILIHVQMLEANSIYSENINKWWKILILMIVIKVHVMLKDHLVCKNKVLLPEDIICHVDIKFLSMYIIIY